MALHSDFSNFHQQSHFDRIIALEFMAGVAWPDEEAMFEEMLRREVEIERIPTDHEVARDYLAG